jgi:hypothetical protein
MAAALDVARRCVILSGMAIGTGQGRATMRQARATMRQARATMRQGLEHCASTALLAVSLGLPAGSSTAQDGQELVASVCTGCHGLNLVERSSGYTEAGWRSLIGSMIGLAVEVRARVRGGCRFAAVGAFRPTPLIFDRCCRLH